MRRTISEVAPGERHAPGVVSKSPSIDRCRISVFAVIRPSAEARSPPLLAEATRSLLLSDYRISDSKALRCSKHV
jgi:hypothetical protein